MLAILFIYSRSEGFSMHGSEMYLGPCTHGESNWQTAKGLLAGDEAAAELNRGKVDPAILGIFSNKRQSFQ
jgi:hypothetical protein